MRLLALLAAGLFAGTLIAADDKKDEKKVKDEEAILGTWKLEEIEGKDPVSKGVFDALYGSIRVTFKKGGKLDFLSATKETTEMEYQIDPSAKPKTIDERAGKSATYALYELDGDTLRVCGNNLMSEYANKAKRPTEFKADKEKGITIFTYKRVKDEKKDK